MSASEILSATELPLTEQLDLLRLFITFKKLFPNMPFDSFVKSADFRRENCLLYTTALRTRQVWGQQQISDETKLTVLSFYADLLEEQPELDLAEFLTEVFEVDVEMVSESFFDDAVDSGDAEEPVEDAPLFAQIENQSPEDAIRSDEPGRHDIVDISPQDYVTAKTFLEAYNVESRVGVALMRLAQATFEHENGALEFVVEINTADDYHFVDAFLMGTDGEVVAEHPPLRDLSFIDDSDDTAIAALTIEYDEKSYHLTLRVPTHDEVASV